VKAALFLGGDPPRRVLSPRLFHVASKLRARGVLLATGLSFCFVLAWLADGIGLAPIVGAFAAGLILEDAHTRDFRVRGERPLGQLVEPISAFLVPVFFVLMGMRTDLPRDHPQSHGEAIDAPADDPGADLLAKSAATVRACGEGRGHRAARRPRDRSSSP